MHKNSQVCPVHLTSQPHSLSLLFYYTFIIVSFMLYMYNNDNIIVIIVVMVLFLYSLSRFQATLNVYNIIIVILSS